VWQQGGVVTTHSSGDSSAQSTHRGDVPLAAVGAQHGEGHGGGGYEYVQMPGKGGPGDAPGGPPASPPAASVMPVSTPSAYVSMPTRIGSKYHTPMMFYSPRAPLTPSSKPIAWASSDLPMTPIPKIAPPAGVVGLPPVPGSARGAAGGGESRVEVSDPHWNVSITEELPPRTPKAGAGGQAPAGAAGGGAQPTAADTMREQRGQRRSSPLASVISNPMSKFKFDSSGVMRLPPSGEQSPRQRHPEALMMAGGVQRSALSGLPIERTSSERSVPEANFQGGGRRHVSGLPEGEEA